MSDLNLTITGLIDGLGYAVTVSSSKLDIQDYIGFDMINYDVMIEDDYEFRLDLPGDSFDDTKEQAFSIIKRVITKMAEKKKWIQEMNMKKGALKEKLGVPEDKKIPAKKLKKAEKSKNPTLKKEADLAATLKSFSKKKK